VILRSTEQAALAHVQACRELTENLSSPLSAESIALKKRFALNLVQYGDVDSGRTLFDRTALGHPARLR